MNLKRLCTVLLAFVCLAIMNASSLAQTFDEMEASVKEHVISNGMIRVTNLVPTELSQKPFTQ